YAFMTIAAAGIGVDGPDQLVERSHAVPDDTGADALRRRDHPSVHHQQTVVPADDELLDQQSSKVCRLGPCPAQCLLIHQTSGEAASLAAAARLQDHRVSDLFGGTSCLTQRP